ncbi:MAG: substrate-binding domain-containing protein [Planctomycetaceae bacterium]|nr:substrate-binding domain-containing protein [Planctomycetaceae bacterium]
MPDQRQIAIALELNQKYPWHQGVYAGVARYAEEHRDWTCIIDECPQIGLADGAPRARRYDGIIARVGAPLARFASRHRIPLVNTWYSSPVGGLSGVYPDCYAMGELCADHLLERGFRQLGIAGVFDALSRREVLRGFTDRAEREPEVTVSVLEYSGFAYGNLAAERRMRRSQNRWLDRLQPPLAIKCESAYHTRQLQHLCQLRGWNIPEDVAFVCDENDPVTCDSPTPSISAVDCNWERIGYEAARLLSEMFGGESRNPTVRLLPPAGIVTRQSTDFYAVTDPLVQQAVQYLSTHLRESVTLPRVAKAVQTSPRTLQRRFEAALGRGVSQELRRLRIACAKRLLMQRGRSIKDVAFLAGFTSSKRLGEVFQRELGCAPSDYQERQSIG